MILSVCLKKSVEGYAKVSLWKVLHGKLRSLNVFLFVKRRH